MIVALVILTIVSILSVVINFIILNATHKKLLYITEKGLEKYVAEGIVKIFPQLKRNKYSSDEDLSLDQINLKLTRFEKLIDDYDRFHELGCNIRKESRENLKESEEKLHEIKKCLNEMRDIKTNIENINNEHLEKLKNVLINDICENVKPEELFTRLLEERYRQKNEE
jgi:hypothetical protein